MKGKLHSIETFGAVDGPGIRTVFFLQGCRARCAYCHNPDTWDLGGGREAGVEEIVRRAVRGKPYYGSEGGVTFSGGEPLLQGEFLAEAITALKGEGIGSAVDTSGTYFDEATERAVSEASLILLDVKHVDAEIFRALTGCGQEPLYKLVEVVKRLEKPVWIRQVVVPGFNDSEEYIEKLNRFAAEISGVEKIELLGYHDLAKAKYEKLGLEYRMRDVKPMNPERLKMLSELTA